MCPYFISGLDSNERINQIHGFQGILQSVLYVFFFREELLQSCVQWKGPTFSLALYLAHLLFWRIRRLQRVSW